MQVKLPIFFPVAVSWALHEGLKLFPKNFSRGDDSTGGMNYRKTEIMWINIEKFEKMEAKRYL